MANNVRKVAADIRALRKASGLRYEDLAPRLGWARRGIYKILKKEVKKDVGKKHLDLIGEMKKEYFPVSPTVETPPSPVMTPTQPKQILMYVDEDFYELYLFYSHLSNGRKSYHKDKITEDAMNHKDSLGPVRLREMKVKNKAKLK